jgi:hypothetical protein
MVCHGARAVVDTFTAQLHEAYEVDALELIGAERHAILHVRGGGVREIELEDGVYNVFAFQEGASCGSTTSPSARRHWRRRR